MFSLSLRQGLKTGFWEVQPRMEFLNYMGAVFEPLSLALLVGGTIGGLILGATPGLSPTMAVALLIPFTFHLQPAQGLILLIALVVGSIAYSFWINMIVPRRKAREQAAGGSSNG